MRTSFVVLLCLAVVAGCGPSKSDLPSDLPSDMPSDAAGPGEAGAAVQGVKRPEPSLKVGNPAPSLDVAKWIKGDPVTLSEGRGTNAYVVEFWASWCGPCKTSIPHLTDLQKKFQDRGLVIVGVTSEDLGKLEVVEQFVADMGDRMDYHVAVDNNRATSNAFMRAAREGGIPHAFVIDTEGKLAWHGHPMSPEFEATIENVAPQKAASAPETPAEEGEADGPAEGSGEEPEEEAE